jgi:PIN domain nuclease of toxin-antitoxin system
MRDGPRQILLTPDLLLDTHVVVWWLTAPNKLSKHQLGVIREAVRQGEILALSGMSLLEIAVMRQPALRRSNREILSFLRPDEGFRIIPIDLEIATEIDALGDSLRDPGDRVIVATARIHGLRLITSDQRIIASKLAPVVE